LTSPLRVVLVTTSLMRGGAETQVFLIAQELIRGGHEVHVVTMRRPEAYSIELAALGIPCTSLGMRSGVPDVRAIFGLARVVRATRPDVVHSHMVHANLLARVARSIAPIPVLVSTAHSLNEGSRWRDLAYRVTDPMATLTTNVCEAAVERFVRIGAVPRHRIRCVPNGLDPEAYRRDEDLRLRLRERLGAGDRFVWLAVGRLERVKDYPTLLRSFVEVLRQRPDSLAFIVSDGPERAALEKLSAQLGLSDHVRFLGARTDVAALLSAADGFVLSSLWEGLPMVLLEAASARLPIVATRVGGNVDVVLDGQSGFLVDASEPPALADAMIRLAGLAPVERANMGATGLAHVERLFHIRQVVARWVAIYRELLARDPRSRRGS
jgi:glycosyltransferase involved in cell wall biosynthesis